MKRSNGIIWLLVFLVWSVCARGETNKNQITVLQWNIWQEGTSVEGGHNAPLGSDWIVEDESAAMQITAVRDTLDIVVPAGLTLWYNKRLTGSYEINYDISMPMEGCPYDRLNDRFRYYSFAPKQGNGYFGLRLLQNHVLFTGFEVKQL